MFRSAARAAAITYLLGSMLLPAVGVLVGLAMLILPGPLVAVPVVAVSLLALVSSITGLVKLLRDRRLPGWVLAIHVLLAMSAIGYGTVIWRRGPSPLESWPRWYDVLFWPVAYTGGLLTLIAVRVLGYDRAAVASDAPWVQGSSDSSRRRPPGA